MTLTFNIYGRDIVLEKDIISKASKYGFDVDEKHIKYLLLTQGIDIETKLSESELTKIVNNLCLEDIQANIEAAVRAGKVIPLILKDRNVQVPEMLWNTYKAIYEFYGQKEYETDLLSGVLDIKEITDDDLRTMVIKNIEDAITCADMNMSSRESLSNALKANLSNGTVY